MLEMKLSLQNQFDSKKQATKFVQVLLNHNHAGDLQVPA